MLDKVQIVEIGMPRTATRSMAQAVKNLGYTVNHGIGFTKFIEKDESIRLKKELWTQLFHGNIPKFPYDNYEYVGNFSLLHWKQLAEVKPDLKFILTIRDVDDWWESCKRRWSRNRRLRSRKIIRSGHIKDKYITTAITVFHLYGCYNLNEFCWKDGFKRHNDEVLRYFKDSDRLLVHNVFEGDGWETLCSFLDADIPKIRYPNTISFKISTKLK